MMCIHFSSFPKFSTSSQADKLWLYLPRFFEVSVSKMPLNFNSDINPKKQCSRYSKLLIVSSVNYLG